MNNQQNQSSSLVYSRALLLSDPAINTVFYLSTNSMVGVPRGEPIGVAVGNFVILIGCCPLYRLKATIPPMISRRTTTASKIYSQRKFLPGSNYPLIRITTSSSSSFIGVNLRHINSLVSVQLSYDSCLLVGKNWVH